MQYSVAQIYTHFAQPFMRDVLVSVLADLGFDSFETESEPLCAYIQSALLDEDLVRQVLAGFAFEGIEKVEILPCEDKDWNEEWERNAMKPILVGSRCVIHPSFAKEVPACEYDIVINPRMAFGTGQHQTTSLMLESILELPIEGREVLDMGCGTAVLAILAYMRGAAAVTAVDIDDWCVENAKSNIELNGITDIEVLLGDARVLAGRHFDVILANINRNILLSDMRRYADCLPKGGLLVISGFYDEDIAILEQHANSLSLFTQSVKTNKKWSRMILVKR